MTVESEKVVKQREFLQCFLKVKHAWFRFKFLYLNEYNSIYPILIPRDGEKRGGIEIQCPT